MADNLIYLSTALGIEKKLLRQALTHSTFYSPEQEHKGNSRLVFSGMFVFRGLVAEVLYHYYPEQGTRLQHILGNLLANKYLEGLFDQWMLMKNARAGAKFDVRAHKHIFTWAILGAVAQSPQAVRQRFIFRYIICAATQHIINHKPGNRNVAHQLNRKALHTIGQNVVIDTKETPEGYCTTVSTGCGKPLSSETSKGYRYSRKKAIKAALCVLADVNFERFVAESDYLDRLKAREAAKREIRAAEVKQKAEQKALLREKRKEQLVLLRKIKDQERRHTAAEAKKRKADRSSFAAAKEAKQQRPLSANKRRFLEDKKK